MNRVRAGYPGQLDDLATLRREPADTVCFLDKRSNRSLHHSSNFSSLLVNELPPLLTSQTGCRGAIRTPVPGFKVQGPATRRPGITLSARLLSCTERTTPPTHRRYGQVSAIRTRTIHQFAVISSALAIELRCKLDFKAFEFNRLCTHNFGSSEENRTPISALKEPHPGR